MGVGKPQPKENDLDVRMKLETLLGIIDSV